MSGLRALPKLSGYLTVKATALVVPPGVETVMFRLPVVVLPLTVKVAVKVVALTYVMPLTVTPPPPVTEIVSPDGVKLVPARVTVTAVPRLPLFGMIEISVGAGGLATANVRPLLFPPEVVTVTVRLPTVVPGAIVNVAVSCVGLATLTPVTVTPVPAATVVAPARKFVPVRVTVNGALPRVPLVGLIVANVGAGGLVTANVTLDDVPIGVFTVTVRLPIPALAVIVSVLVTVVPLLLTTGVLAVTPVPETLTAVAPVKLVPVRVTETWLP
jgi:hypothetical protein